LLVNIQIRLRSLPWPSDTIFAFDLPKCFNNRNRNRNKNRTEVEICRYPNALQNIHKLRKNSLSNSISFAAPCSPVQLLCTSIMSCRWIFFSIIFVCKDILSIISWFFLKRDRNRNRSRNRNRDSVLCM